MLLMCLIMLICALFTFNSYLILLNSKRRRFLSSKAKAKESLATSNAVLASFDEAESNIEASGLVAYYSPPPPPPELQLIAAEVTERSYFIRVA